MDSELGFRLRVEGSGFRVYILGFRVQGVEVRSRDPSTLPTLVRLFMQPHARPRSHNLPIPVLSLSLSMARPDGAPPELLHGPECPPPAPALCRADTGCTCSKVCAGLCAATPPLPVTPPSLACCSWSQHPLRYRARTMRRQAELTCEHEDIHYICVYWSRAHSQGEALVDVGVRTQMGMEHRTCEIHAAALCVKSHTRIEYLHECSSVLGGGVIPTRPAVETSREARITIALSILYMPNPEVIWIRGLAAQQPR